MESAVSMALAGVSWQPTPWDILETRDFRGFKVSRQTALWLTAFPIADGISGRQGDPAPSDF